LIAAMLCSFAALGRAAEVMEEDDATVTGSDGRCEQIAAITFDLAVVRLLAAGNWR
jgi:hypothetical protein